MNLETLTLPLKVDSSAFKAGIAAGVAGVTALVGAMGLAIAKTFQWAGELDSITDVMDVSNKTAAAFNFTLKKSGTATDTFTRGMVILGKGLIDANGKLDATGKALKKWGIDVLDSNGALKDQTALIGEVADKYNSFATQQERVNFLTEVFGKSGAGLIDFFDTLAADGGLDAVTKKVEALGLAIDPGRYEQFNRNLEELKLIGLGLAVGFTEKVMPAIEKFTGLITDFAVDPDLGKLAKTADNFIAGIVQGMANSVNVWVAGGGPQELSDMIVSWIENIGTGGEIDSKALKAVQNLVDALVRAFGQIDWSAIDGALDVWDEKILAFFDQMDADILATFDQWDAQILEAFDQWDASIMGKLNQLDASANAVFLNMMSGLGQKAQSGLDSVDTAFATWSVSVGARVAAWGTELVTSVTNSMTTLKGNIDTKLAAISEEFQRRAGAWLRKAADAFVGQKDVLLDAIRTLVGEINKALKGIITSFTISIKLPDFLGGGSTGTTGAHNPGQTTTTGSGGGTTGRASGGPTIAGQPYRVFDTPFDEIFMSNRSGRIDPLTTTGMQSVTIANWFDFDYARLATEVVKAQNNT